MIPWLTLWPLRHRESEKGLGKSEKVKVASARANVTASNWSRLWSHPGQSDESSGDPNQIVVLLQLVRPVLASNPTNLVKASCDYLTLDPCYGRGTLTAQSLSAIDLRYEGSWTTESFGAPSP